MIRRVVAAVALVVLAAVLVVAAWPQLFGLESAPVIAQVVSLRGVDVAIALAIAIVVIVIAGAFRSTRRFFGSVAVLLLVFCVASVGILADRGFGDTATASEATGDVTVLSWNTKGDAPGAPAIARLALAEHADIVTLPETTHETGVAVANLMKASGRPMWVYWRAYGLGLKGRSTTLLVSTALGTYKVTDTSRTTAILPTVIAVPDNGTGPTIIAVHAVSPIPKQMRNWRSDLKRLAARCVGPNTIMAGDFNSTLDTLEPHSTRSGADFGECSDAGHGRHAAAVGSWPTNLPPLLGAQIDHVMFTSAWKATSMHVVGSEDAAGSDHRPIVATLAPAH
jgi:endonuclease/exonuclease/phosphatase (EEP) superfamily protein YafD